MTRQGLSVSRCSVGCSVDLSRTGVGVLVACVGVDTLAPGCAPRLELCGAQDHADHVDALRAEVIFSKLGLPLPLGIGPMELVRVFHDGLDLLEIFGVVPDHAHYAD